MAESRRWHCIHCGQTFVSSDTDQCSLCRKPGGLVDPMDQAAITRKRAEAVKLQAAALPASPQANWPHWLTAGRIWVIFKLGSVGLLMLALAIIFALTLDLQIAVYPFLGFLICLSALVVFFWRWRREAPARVRGEIGESAEQSVADDGGQ